jgi:hypothetical protein
MGFCTENARLRRLILTRAGVAAQFLRNFTFSRGWAEIAFFHRAAGLASPTDQRVVRDLLEGARRAERDRTRFRAPMGGLVLQGFPFHG